MDRSGVRTGGAKRDAVVVGAATMERIVRARYEWRDGGMRKRKRPRDGDRESGAQQRQR